MKRFYVYLCSASLLLAACTPQEPETRKLDMTQFTFASPEEIASMRVDFSNADMQLIQTILAAASRVLSQKSSLEQETEILGEPDYYVPKLSSEEIRSVGFERGYLTRFPARNDWDQPSVFKGFGYGFRREATLAPWTHFGMEVKHLYEYSVNLPMTQVFLDTLGLVLIKTAPDHPCDTKGKCHAFVYRSRLYPTLRFVFLTDVDRSDLSSGLPANFRSVDIDVIGTTLPST